MASEQRFTPSKSVAQSASFGLAEILSGPLPSLPAGAVPDVAAVLRGMSSSKAAAVWRHPGWGDLVGWIHRRVPDCDPTVAAVHAVRNAAQARKDPEYARILAGYLVRVALSSTSEPRVDIRTEELTWDPPMPPATYRRTDSLADDARRLLSGAGIVISDAVWSVLAPSIDIAVDWWDALASRTGLAGDELVAAARQQNQTTTNWRLSGQFDGPAARPLVALLVGGDHKGRRAREATGVEAGLLYWSLRVRATRPGADLPTPPTPIVRAWATNIGWIRRSVEGNPATTRPNSDPTIAA